MGGVSHLERQRVERLAQELVPELRDRGQVYARTADLESVERWRAAARRAGRLLRWHVRTRVSDDGSFVWAVSDDYPVSEGEMRLALLRFSQLIHGH